jgi:DNA-binding MarR family transcriptional regulator
LTTQRSSSDADPVPDTGDEVPPFTATELGAWRGMLSTHARLVRHLDDELQRSQGITLTSYEVLMLVADTSDGRRRISDLSHATLLSLSGVSRLVDRLVRDGFLAKERCDDDRRGWFARITPEGRARLESARRVHRAGIRREFITAFSGDELRQMEEFWERLADRRPS